MESMMKELMPVIKEAIIAGKMVGMWWIFGLYFLGFLKSLIGYFLTWKVVELLFKTVKQGYENATD